jgi:hypothetical protein
VQSASLSFANPAGLARPVAAGGRQLALAASLALVSTLALVSVLGQANPHRPTTTLSKAERTALSRILGGLDPSLRIAFAGSELETANAPQHLHARFTSAGLRLNIPGAELRMRATSLRAGDHTAALAPARPRLLGGRAVYEHPALREWYANGPQGLEQGFTLERPRHSAAHVQISLAVSPEAHPKLLPGAGGVAFSGGLRYGHLTASDARGRAVPSWMTVSGSTVELHLDVRRASYPINVDPLFEHAQLSAGEEGGDWFGYSVALSGDGGTAIVGGPHARGETGAAWVFARSGTSWTPQAELSLPAAAGAASRPGAAVRGASSEEETAGYHFGARVVLSADGDTAVVSSPGFEGGLGAVWVFTRTGSAWGAPTKLAAGGAERGEGRFGRGVALTPDGTSVVVGAPRDANGTGAAWLFKRNGSGWAAGPELTAPDAVGEAHFGGSVAISAHADTVLVGGPGDDGYVGKAWVFARQAEGFGVPTTLHGAPASAGEGRFGRDVALSAEGDTALIGAPGEAAGAGGAYVFARSSGLWSQQGPELTGGEEAGEGGFGHSTALTADGATALIGGPQDGGGATVGAAWEFARSGGAWAQQGAKLVVGAAGAHGQFGYDVALDAAADTALIGALRPNGTALGSAWVLTTEPPSEGGSGSEPPPKKGRKQPPSSTPTPIGGVLGFSEAHPLTSAQQSAVATTSRVRLASRTIYVRGKGRAAVKLVCSDGSTRCAGRLTLATYRRAGRRIVKTAIGSAKFTIAPGKATVALTLTSRGRRYLSARRGRLSGALSILDPPAKAQTAAVKVRVQRAAVRRRAARR